MKRLLATATVLTAVGLAGPTHGAITVDGTLDSDYGSALAVQGIGTQFGDNNNADVGPANGSELDAGYAVIQNGTLHLFLAGNLESNFNKLDIFIDSVAGGMNRVTPLTTDQGGFNRMADDGSGNGLTFDTGFGADHWISVTGGGDPVDIFVDYADLLDDQGFYAGQTTPTNGTLTGGNGGPTIAATWNNSNVGGVAGLGSPNTTDPATVNTGVELAIALADLDNPTGTIRISAFINGGGHDFLSNQVLGSLPADTGNLGEPRTVDFSQIAGDQFFSVAVPEPASLGLMAMGGALMLWRRHRVV